MDRADFERYLACFNARDIDGFSAFYTDDVVLEPRAQTELKGRGAICDFYAGFWKLCDERLTLKSFVLDDDGLAAEIGVEFKARADVPDFSAGPLRLGASIFMTSMIFYTRRGDLFSYIKARRVEAPYEGAPTF